MHNKTQKQGELTQTTLFLIWLTSLATIENRSKPRLKKEIFIFVKNIVLTKSWFVVSNFSEFSKAPYGKIIFWPSVFPTKNQIYFFQNFLVTKYLRQVNQTHLSYRNYFSIFVLRWDVFKLIKNPFIKFKKQLMLTNFILVMHKISEKY